MNIADSAMGLFSNLRNLYRSERYLVEDPHTEIAAQVLRNSPSLALAWLRDLGATSLSVAKMVVATQERFPQLPEHSCASRPDMTIRIFDKDETCELIFVESKLPAEQGHDQLQRYADHLALQFTSCGLKKASLIYITRSYEAVTKPFVKGSDYQPEFLATRWFRFYHHLSHVAQDDGLARELAIMMKENNMSTGNQFRSAELVALENFVSAKALMDETLDGEVQSAAAQIFSLVKPDKDFEELVDDPRYVLCFGKWASGRFTLRIGYWLYPNSPAWVGVTLYLLPTPQDRKTAFDAMAAWAANAGPEWKAEQAENGWLAVFRGRNLQSLMAPEDHVQAVKDYLLQVIAGIDAFRQAHPSLPWAVTCG